MRFRRGSWCGRKLGRGRGAYEFAGSGRAKGGMSGIVRLEDGEEVRLEAAGDLFSRRAEAESQPRKYIHVG